MIEMLQLDVSQFKDNFSRNAIIRTKRSGWVRNLCTVLGNLKQESALPQLLVTLKTDPDPICRYSAARALINISPEKYFLEIQSACENEPNNEIRQYFLRLLK